MKLCREEVYGMDGRLLEHVLCNTLTSTYIYSEGCATKMIKYPGDLHGANLVG